jgi:predicted RNase H-like nuclease (RuvC/YqgF family)
LEKWQTKVEELTASNNEMKTKIAILTNTNHNLMAEVSQLKNSVFFTSTLMETQTNSLNNYIDYKMAKLNG